MSSDGVQAGGNALVAQADAHLTSLLDTQAGSKPFVSIEFYPPKTEAGINTLYDVLEKLKKFKPLFADVTWGAGGSTSDLTVELCQGIKSRGVIPNLHLTCTNMEKSKIDDALKSCKAGGITNILALRGDPPAGESVWHAADASLKSALDLVNYIRKDYVRDEVSIRYIRDLKKRPFHTSRWLGLGFTCILIGLV